ncbi:MAG: phosphoglycerate mutase, partial [Clostridia bacterium]|nr:phosphoglycerate mutase [Clostridia bacterium]
VEGATGNYKTNFLGKAKACVDALNDGLDFVYVHIESADECGHQGDLENKIYSIEQIDKVVEYVATNLQKTGERFKILLCPDHPTPISIKTHASDFVPYLIYDSQNVKQGQPSYTENSAKQTNIYYPNGESLIKNFFAK